MEAIFNHLDKDKGGTISGTELAEGLRALPNFKALTDEDIQSLVTAIDSDKSGEISFEEFSFFVTGKVQKPISKKAASHLADEANVDIVSKVKAIFRAAAEKGLSFEKTFQLLERERDGSDELDSDQLLRALQQLPSLKQVQKGDIVKLMQAVNRSERGRVTVAQFKAFVSEGIDNSRGAEGKERDEEVKGRDSKDDDGAAKGSLKVGAQSNQEEREVFVRILRRISELDGSVSAMLAFLDDDEDGLISVTSLKNILRRGDAFVYLSESAVDRILAPITIPAERAKHHAGGSALIKVTELLRLVAGRDGEVSMDKDNDSAAKQQADQTHEVQREYSFSADPETRAVEKKLRNFGSLLSKRAVDVESVFRAYGIFDEVFSLF